MKVDLIKNLEYYNDDKSTPCDCDVCKIYYKFVKEKYPEITTYLEKLNIDILRPFELVWIENEKDKTIEYESCQYIVFGECEETFMSSINDIVLKNNVAFHPSTKHIDGKHFVLELGEIVFPNIL